MKSKETEGARSKRIARWQLVRIDATNGRKTLNDGESRGTRRWVTEGAGARRVDLLDS
jgi:hypothetical protein